MKTYADRPWIEYWDPKINRHPPLADKPVYQLMVDSFHQFPHHVALYFYGTEITYAELESLTNKMANSLVKLGVNKGDRVAICMDNCPQYVIAFFAVLKAGGIVVQITPMATGRELLYLLNDSGSRGIITLDYLWPRIKEVMGESALTFAIVGSMDDYLPQDPFPGRPFGVPENPPPIESVPPVYQFRMLLNASCTFAPPPIHSHEDIAVLQYTSGTTGFAKGVMVTHFNLVSYITLMLAMDWKSEPGKEVYPVTLPMSHNYGMYQTVLAPLAIGGKVVIMVRFHPDETLKTIDRLHPTVFRAVPTMLTMLATHPRIKEYDLSSIRHWIVGGAPVPDELVAKFRELSGANVVEGYGLTESTSGVIVNALYGQTYKGMGFPGIYTDVRVVNPETGEDVPLGEVGELWLKGPTISPGYWGKPEETAKTFTDGWLHTGDLVRMSEYGVLEFVDRLKEMIIVSGFNVYPTEVENVLYEHPGVMEVAVIGWPDERQGEVVKAVIAPQKGVKLTANEIIDFCKERLTAYKVPKIVEFMDSLPKNPTGKIQKKALKRDA